MLSLSTNQHCPSERNLMLPRKKVPGDTVTYSPQRTRFDCSMTRGMFPYLFLLLTVGCQETILHDLSEQDANRAFVALSRSGIEVEKILEGTSWAIAVNNSRVPQALTALEDSRVLNRDSIRSSQPAGGVFQSREERLITLRQTIAAELEGTLERFAGVVEARVHLHLVPAPARSFGLPPDRQSASVLLVTTVSVGSLEHEVRRLVAGATAMRHDEITVVLTTRENYQPAEVPQPTLAPNPPANEPPAASIAGASSPDWLQAPSQLRVLLLIGCLLALMLSALHLHERRKTDRMLRKLRNGAGGPVASYPEVVQ